MAYGHCFRGIDFIGRTHRREIVAALVAVHAGPWFVPEPCQKSAENGHDAG